MKNDRGIVFGSFEQILGYCQHAQESLLPYFDKGMHFEHTVLLMACKVESDESADLQRGMHK